MLTADTITDEQIRSMSTGSDLEQSLASIALDPIEYHDHWYLSRNDARSRCAEILNARSGK